MFNKKDKDSKSSKEPMTPEEKLFRVISRDKTYGYRSDENGDDEILDHSWMTRLESILRAIKDMFRKDRSEHQTRAAGRGFEDWRDAAVLQLRPFLNIFQIKVINRILLMFVLLLAIYLALDAVFYKVQNWTIPIGPQESQTTNLNALYAVPAQRDLSRYLQSASKRNLFLKGAKPVSSTPLSTAPQEVNENIQKAPPNFKLLGISWDDTGYVAMVQYDPAKEGAVFVRKGETIGNFKVGEIKEFSVTLTDGSQKWELS